MRFVGSGGITSDLPGREISIRSGDEGTSLIVEAPKDTVHHYNFLESLDVQAIHHRSYHEHGKVRGNVKLKQGEFVAEPNSEVETVIITSASAEGVSVVNNSGHTIEAAATNQEVLDALGTIVSGGTSSSLYGKLVDEEVLSNFAGGLGTTESPFLIANERQWETLVTTASFFQKNYNWSVISDLDFTGLEGSFGGKAFYGNIDFNNHSFKGLSATNDGAALAGSSIAMFYILLQKTSISNLNFYCSGDSEHPSRIAHFTTAARPDGEYRISFKNVNTYGTVQNSDNNISTFLAYADSPGPDLTLDFIGCNNYATIINSEGYTGVFVGRVYCSPVITLNFENCCNYGNVVALNGSASMLVSNPTQSQGHTANFNIANCVNYGKIVGTIGTDNLVTSDIEGLKILSDEQRAAFQNEGKIFNAVSGVLAIADNPSFGVEDGKYVLPSTEGVDHYALTFSFQGCSGANGGVVDFTCILSEEDLDNVCSYPWIDIEDVENKSSIAQATIGNKTIGVYDNRYVFERGNLHLNDADISVTLVAYSEDGEVMSFSVLKEE